MTLLNGAALGVHELAGYADWLREEQRDPELQTFHAADVLNGDWQPLADQVRRGHDPLACRVPCD
jgi:hypothetical protein